MKATPEQWDDTEHWASRYGHAQACILELRARVEALEAANSKPAPSPSQSGSSLVERVMGVLGHYGPGTARAAIREVAAWLVDQHADSDGFIQSNVGCVIGQLHEEAGSTLKKENFNA